MRTFSPVMWIPTFRNTILILFSFFIDFTLHAQIAAEFDGYVDVYGNAPNIRLISNADNIFTQTGALGSGSNTFLISYALLINI